MFTESPSCYCVVLVSLIQLPAINFSEAKLPGNRFAISDKLARFCSTIDSHNENSVINVVLFFCLCARKLNVGNLCSVICIPLYPTDRVFSVSLPFLLIILFHFTLVDTCSLWLDATSSCIYFAESPTNLI